MKLNMTFEQFAVIVGAIEKKCSRFGCGYDRRDCREGEVSRLTREWFGKNRNGDGDDALHIILGGMENVLPDYFTDRWRHKKSPAKLTAHRQTTYDKLVKNIEK